MSGKYLMILVILLISFAVPAVAPRMHSGCAQGYTFNETNWSCGYPPGTEPINLGSSKLVYINNTSKEYVPGEPVPTQTPSPGDITTAPPACNTPWAILPTACAENWPSLSLSTPQNANQYDTITIKVTINKIGVPDVLIFNDGRQIGTTNDNGMFNFRGDKTGTYHISAMKQKTVSISRTMNVISSAINTPISVVTATSAQINTSNPSVSSEVTYQVAEPKEVTSSDIITFVTPTNVPIHEEQNQQETRISWLESILNFVKSIF